VLIGAAYSHGLYVAAHNNAVAVLQELQALK